MINTLRFTVATAGTFRVSINAADGNQGNNYASRYVSMPYNYNNNYNNNYNYAPNYNYMQPQPYSQPYPQPYQYPQYPYGNYYRKLKAPAPRGAGAFCLQLKYRVSLLLRG